MNAKPVCDRDVDLMRDVYMTREQRAAYHRILDAAQGPKPYARPQPAAWDAIVAHCVATEAVTPDESDPYGTIGRLLDYHSQPAAPQAPEVPYGYAIVPIYPPAEALAAMIGYYKGQDWSPSPPLLTKRQLSRARTAYARFIAAIATPPAPEQPKPDTVTVPREVVAAYARSTHVPRHRRICEAALAEQPKPVALVDVGEGPQPVDEVWEQSRQNFVCMGREQPKPAGDAEADALAHVYAAGRLNGHLNTVEGTYVDAMHCDYAELFSETAREVYDDACKHMAAQPATGAGDAEADAARYRWLRDGNNERQSTFAQELATKHYGFEWDAIIDMARLSAQPAQGEGEK